MSILDTNNDFDLTVTDIWEVRVNWYKYDNEAKFEQRLKEELNKSQDLICKLEVNQKSPPELTNLIESLLPPQATNISSIFKIGLANCKNTCNKTQPLPLHHLL